MISRRPEQDRAVSSTSLSPTSSPESVLPSLTATQVVTAERRLVPGSSRSKRALDLVFGVGLLLLTAPIMLVLILAVKISSPGPAFFRQVRVGRDGEEIKVAKFRSMVVNSEDILNRDPDLKRKYVESNYKLPPTDDPRITQVGRFLRKSSLDELPQLWNVVIGDMSLVGPRPILYSELAYFGDREDAYTSCRPGLTGAWQVSGRSSIGWNDGRADYDVCYTDEWTFLKDVQILAKTPMAVLSGSGAY